jgi:hypothetical protein
MHMGSVSSPLLIHPSFTNEGILPLRGDERHQRNTTCMAPSNVSRFHSAILASPEAILTLIAHRYTKEQMNNVTVAHRECRDWRDRVALTAVRVLRWGLDLASGYRHQKALALNEKDPVAAAQKYGMTEKKYLIRNIFLESVAGVPGIVAGMMRHLRSMRRMKRDNGW